MCNNLLYTIFNGIFIILAKFLLWYSMLGFLNLFVGVGIVKHLCFGQGQGLR